MGGETLLKWPWRVKMPTQNLLRMFLLSMLMKRIILARVCCWFKCWGLVSSTQPSGPLCLWQCLANGFPWDVTVNNGSWSPEVGSPPLVAFPGRENAFINCWNLQLKDDQWSFSNWKIGEPSVFVFCLGCSHILKSYNSGSGSQAFLGYNFKRGTLRGTFIADGQGEYQRNHLEFPRTFKIHCSHYKTGIIHCFFLLRKSNNV